MTENKEQEIMHYQGTLYIKGEPIQMIAYRDQDGNLGLAYLEDEDADRFDSPWTYVDEGIKGKIDAEFKTLETE